MSQYSAAELRYNAVTRQQRAVTRPAIQSGAHATRRAMRSRHGLGCDTIFIVTGGKGQPRCDTAHLHVRARSDTTTIRPRGPATWPVLGLRYGTLHATTRPRHGRPGRSAGGLCAQAGPGCAPGAPDSVLTQCTVLSHCLDHCS